MLFAPAANIIRGEDEPVHHAHQRVRENRDAHDRRRRGDRHRHVHVCGEDVREAHQRDVA